LASTKFRDVELCRDVSVPTYRFINFFKGFEKVKAVRQIFGKETEKILSELKVGFFSFGSARALIGVNDQNGHLFMNADYLKLGDVKDIYLDVIHELVHVKQFRDGKQLHGTRFDYVDNPTEIEAYRHTVDEAKRIGLSNADIYEYLKVDWITDEDTKKLAKTLGIEVGN
jgi:hypothetical protein